MEIQQLVKSIFIFIRQNRQIILIIMETRGIAPFFSIDSRNIWILTRFQVSFSGFVGKDNPAGAVPEKAPHPVLFGDSA